MDGCSLPAGQCSRSAVGRDAVAFDHDDDRRERHGCRRHKRSHVTADGNRHRDGVVADGQCEILADQYPRIARDFERVRDRRKALVQEDEVRCVAVRCRLPSREPSKHARPQAQERRSGRHRPSEPCFQPRAVRRCARPCRQEPLRPEFFDPKMRRQRLNGRLSIAGQDLERKALPLKTGDRLPGIGPAAVLERKPGQRRSVSHEERNGECAIVGSRRFAAKCPVRPAETVDICRPGSAPPVRSPGVRECCRTQASRWILFVPRRSPPTLGGGNRPRSPLPSRGPTARCRVR